MSNDQWPKWPKFPGDGWDQCYLCNQPINFADRYEVTVTVQDLPLGARHPSLFLYAHEECARRSAHPDFVIPDEKTTF